MRPTPAPPSLPYPRDTKEPKGFRPTLSHPPRRQPRHHAGMRHPGKDRQERREGARVRGAARSARRHPSVGMQRKVLLSALLAATLAGTSALPVEGVEQPPRRLAASGLLGVAGLVGLVGLAGVVRSSSPAHTRRSASAPRAVRSVSDPCMRWMTGDEDDHGAGPWSVSPLL